MNLKIKNLLIVVLAAKCFFATSVTANERNILEAGTNQINVTGVGEIEAEPDQAVLNISITVTKDTLVEAKQDADEKYQQVLNVIEKADIPTKQYKVTNLNSYPQYQWGFNKRSEYKGQKITRSMSITINDLEKLSPLMQALVENGVSTITSISPSFQDESGLQRQALDKAIDDASSKAAFIAQKLNRDLGEVLSITEQSAPISIFQTRTFQLEGLAASAASKSVSPPPEAFGTQKIQTNINASFKLCLLYTSPSPRDKRQSRMPSSA